MGAMPDIRPESPVAERAPLRRPFVAAAAAAAADTVEKGALDTQIKEQTE
jgi:hypothetical protein